MRDNLEFILTKSSSYEYSEEEVETLFTLLRKTQSLVVKNSHKIRLKFRVLFEDLLHTHNDRYPKLNLAHRFADVYQEQKADTKP